MLKRVQIYYSGRVQGVGFRYTVRQIAHGYDVVGYVRNLPDNRVELVAEGEEAELKRFLNEVATGDLSVYIRHATVDWSAPTGGFREFSIRL
jgi:acylphosphatase